MKTTNSIVIGGVKLIIGAGASKEVGKEAKSRGLKKVLVVTDKGIAGLGLHKDVLDSLNENEIPYILYDKVPSDPPVSVVKEGALLIQIEECDGVVAIGGGSVMDAAKAMNMMSVNEGEILEYDNSPTGGRSFRNPGHPLLTVPTTSGTGSEVTQYAVISSVEEKRKATIGDPMLVSKAAFLDPVLTMGLPRKITAATGIDAMAHAIEAYTSNRVLDVPGSSVFSDTYALQAVRMISHSLRTACNTGQDMKARKEVMLGATMAGFISQAGSGAAHGMGTPLGAHYHVPHGLAVGMMLPYVMEYNAAVCPERLKDIAGAMGCHIEGMDLKEAALEASREMKRLLKDIGFSTLNEFVKEEKELEILARDAMKDKCCQLNAKALDEKTILEIYKQVWKGEY